MEITELYRALEFAHYAERLRGTLTLVGLSRNISFTDLLLDIKLLAAHRARLILIVPDPNFELARQIALLNTHGGRFRIIEAEEPQNQKNERLRVNINLLKAAIDNDEVPVVVHHGLSVQGSALAEMENMVRDIIFSLGIKRFVGLAQASSLVNALTQTRLTLSELNEIQERADELGISVWKPRLQFVQTLLEGGVSEVIYLSGVPGNLTEELFTHHGNGVLFSRHDDSLIRRAELRDVNDIMLQLRPEIENKRILPVNENAISEHINDFFVYEVDNRIIATMRLKRYGTWIELATGSTLNRDRKRGRAHELILKAIEAVEQEPGAEVMFGVSIDERIASMLEPLGFVRIEKSEMPDEWKNSYDQSRQSMIYAKKIGDR